MSGHAPYEPLTDVAADRADVKRVTLYSEALDIGANIAEGKFPDSNRFRILFQFPFQRTAIEVKSLDDKLFDLLAVSQLDGTWVITTKNLNAAEGKQELQDASHLPDLTKLLALASELKAKKSREETALEAGKRVQKIKMLLARVAILYHKQLAGVAGDEPVTPSLWRVLKTSSYWLTMGVIKNFELLVVWNFLYSAFHNANPEKLAGGMVDLQSLPMHHTIMAIAFAALSSIFTTQNEFNNIARTTESVISVRKANRLQWDWRAIQNHFFLKYGASYEPENLDGDALMGYVAPSYPLFERYNTMWQSGGQIYMNLLCETVDGASMALITLMPFLTAKFGAQYAAVLSTLLGGMFGMLMGGMELRSAVTIGWDSYAAEHYRKTGEVIPPLSQLSAGVGWKERDVIKILRFALPMFRITGYTLAMQQSSLFNRIITSVGSRSWSVGDAREVDDYIAQHSVGLGFFKFALGALLALGVGAKTVLYDIALISKSFFGEKLIQWPFKEKSDVSEDPLSVDEKSPCKERSGYIANKFAQLLSAEFIWTASCGEDRDNVDGELRNSGVARSSYAGAPTFLGLSYSLSAFFKKHFILEMVVDGALLPNISSTASDWLAQPLWQDGAIRRVDLFTIMLAAVASHHPRKQAMSAFYTEKDRRRNDVFQDRRNQNEDNLERAQFDVVVDGLDGGQGRSYNQACMQRQFT